jgi:methylmalonyl-CoA mutase C-terminal domain/subunit
LLREREAGDIPVIAGGIIPEKDIPRMKKIGVREIFLPGTSTQEIVCWIQDRIGGQKK